MCVFVWGCCTSRKVQSAPAWLGCRGPVQEAQTLSRRSCAIHAAKCAHRSAPEPNKHAPNGVQLCSDPANRQPPEPILNDQWTMRGFRGTTQERNVHRQTSNGRFWMLWSILKCGRSPEQRPDRPLMESPVVCGGVSLGRGSMHDVNQSVHSRYPADEVCGAKACWVSS